ncbi:MAG: hypothetical protein Q9160_008585 [Pyrenula sp. 1 TL-2023]
MAEVIGALASSLTIATLFKVCIEAFDLIQIARHQDTDLQNLALRFNIEKCRLYIWGEAMGLTTPPQPGYTRPLESLPFQELVRNTLQVILEILQDTQKMEQVYGCREAQTSNSRKCQLSQIGYNDPVKILSTTFSNFRITGVPRSRARNLALQIKWVVYDRKKFSNLIMEAKALIDGLQEITKSLSTVARQEGMMRYNIQQIEDPNTLEQLAVVSQQDYPDMSDAASIKSDVLTVSSHRERAIQNWIDDVYSEPEDEILESEAMTIAELKHRIRVGATGRTDSRARLDQEIQDSLSNDREHDYDLISVLLIEWEESEQAFRDETTHVESLFREKFRYPVSRYKIPSERSWLCLHDRIQDLARWSESARCLSIIYYGGYSTLDIGRDEAIWASRNRDGPTLSWSEIQPLLGQARGNILLILDYCFAARAARAIPLNVELIASCAKNSQTCSPGPHSFTSMWMRLIEEHLELGKPIVMRDIMRHLVSADSNLKATPIYLPLCQRSPIRLKPYTPAPEAAS